MTNFPKALLRDFRRLIRDPIIRWLSCDDLIIVGDVYVTAKGPAVIQVPGNASALIVGSIAVHDGPAAIVPRGCKPLSLRVQKDKQKISSKADAILGEWCKANDWRADIPPRVLYDISIILRATAEQVTPQIDIKPQEDLESRREAMEWGMRNQTQVTRLDLLTLSHEIERRIDD